MKILVINSGSSTVKFQIIETTEASDELRSQKKRVRGLVERIGGEASYRFEVRGGATISESTSVQNHEEAVRLIIDWLRSNLTEGSLGAVGHRVVHGGSAFTSPVLIDDRFLARIDVLGELAPLHNPAAVNGIRAARSILGPTMPMVAA
ncbi:MAG: acetate kinase, partial [Deltaproteobacteria bacterium]|nr:acetate kinase [Deltaproteobacteria bacterium]